jgi:short-subunit dehydrogenase
LLAGQGFALAICARNAAELQAMQAQLEAAGSPKVLAVPTDMAQNEAVQQFAEQALAAFPAIDILVNNAGIFIPGDLCDEAEGHLEHMMRVNLFSAYDLTRHIVPGMKTRKQGHIFNMCSVASLKAYTQGGSYSISKYALLGFSDNLREELKPHNIKVTALCPGATQSRSWSGSGVPDERIMEATDVANMLWAAYTLSRQATVEMIVMRPQQGDL